MKGSKLGLVKYFVYKYVVTTIFVVIALPLTYLGIMDLTTTSVTSVFSTAAVVWDLLTAYLLYLAYHMEKKDFLE